MKLPQVLFESISFEWRDIFVVDIISIDQDSLYIPQQVQFQSFKN